MFSRILSSAIKRLAVDNPADVVFSPVGPGTQHLCSRCHTLLSNVIMEFGDGTGCDSLEMSHSSSMSQLSRTPCVICAKTLLLFDAMRRHVSFEHSLRESPFREWSLTWKFDFGRLSTYLVIPS
ncbi:hypothetical protein BKA59DRAFT_203133 [Fusarium tricinctum]|uniref:C2H2-type domain-containing protein n=1 Tax=Fusarium tricinctum TaxID=61284 RepID=A0A8K0RTA5_9HYPO|nr:hypothetical protein BKA59DRAFT_203133 [Fusarium tricinctum]